VSKTLERGGKMSNLFDLTNSIVDSKLAVRDLQSKIVDQENELREILMVEMPEALTINYTRIFAKRREVNPLRHPR